MRERVILSSPQKQKSRKRKKRRKRKCIKQRLTLLYHHNHPWQTRLDRQIKKTKTWNTSTNRDQHLAQSNHAMFPENDRVKYSVNWYNNTCKFKKKISGVHEVCVLCGSDDHHLKTCPNKQPACLEMVVEKLQDSSLNSTVSSESPEAEWTKILPKRRGRPKNRLSKSKKQFSKGNHAQQHEKPSFSPSLPKDISKTIPTSNQFDNLDAIEEEEDDDLFLLQEDLQIANSEDISTLLPTDPMFNTDDMLVETVNNRVTAMVVQENLKRRKREDDSPSSSMN